MLKKNAFNFGLELILLALALVSLGVNQLSNQPYFRSPSNRFLSYLLQHPDLNKYIIAEIKTEKINVAPERGSIIAQAQAATLDPIAGTAATTTGAIIISADNAIMKPNFASKSGPSGHDIQVYTVKAGDSISKIASTFGVSVQTVLYDNKLDDASLIKPGQQLEILPTTGLKHTVAKGETLGSIARKYKVDPGAILDYNGIEIPEDILPGDTLIIPDGKVELPPAAQSSGGSYSRSDAKRATVPSNFAGTGAALEWPLPTRNITQYFSSYHRALDISNGERPQFWAAGDGIVELSGWDGAYGQSIVINHGNGVKTRYAHASELYVSAGDHVKAGQIIGRVGNTGHVVGRTGNHLHFEVVVNNVKTNPLRMVK